MILIGLGSNLTTSHYRSSVEVLEAAIKAMEQKGIAVTARSPWYRSAPIPVSDQPWFVNGVVSVRTDLAPVDLLQALHGIEHEFGRVRSQRNASRTLDLDLLVYDERVTEEQGGLVLPHPRLAERAFVLLPLADLVPSWRHPLTGATPLEMLKALPPGQQVEKLA